MKTFKFEVEAQEMPVLEFYCHDRMAKGNTPEGKKFVVERMLPMNDIVIGYEGKRYILKLSNILEGLMPILTKK